MGWVKAEFDLNTQTFQINTSHLQLNDRRVPPAEKIPHEVINYLPRCVLN